MAVAALNKGKMGSYFWWVQSFNFTKLKVVMKMYSGWWLYNIMNEFNTTGLYT
jgi:hypothetical protein